MKQQLPCAGAMSSSTRKHTQWAELGENGEGPEEPSAETEVKSGDLYLLSSGDVSTTAGSSSAGKRRASRYPVHVKVYRSPFDHYAILTTTLRAPATYLNLRTCNCRPWAGGSRSTSSGSSSSSSSSSSSASRSAVNAFRVELGGGEGQVMYFELNPKDKGGVEGWVKAFQGVMVPSPGTISPSLSPVIPRNPIMPMLQESVEEEEDEEEIAGLP